MVNSKIRKCGAVLIVSSLLFCTWAVFSMTRSEYTLGSITGASIKFSQFMYRQREASVREGRVRGRSTPVNTTMNHRTLLCLFTTFTATPGKKFIHLNLIKNWSKLPGVTQILFNDAAEVEVLNLASSLNWIILEVPKRNKGVPVFKAMYEEAHSAARCGYYGFANGDIMFSESLVTTVNVTEQFFSSTSESVLIIGGRKNYKYDNSSHLLSIEELPSLKVTGPNTWAVDYFIIRNNNFPWNRVPDLVIGRPGYDNFMVAHAISNNVSVVDATRTLLAVHLVGVDGMNSGFKHKTGNVNYKLIGKNYDLKKGQISKSQFLSAQDKDGVVNIKRRRVNTTT